MSPKRILGSTALAGLFALSLPLLKGGNVHAAHVYKNLQENAKTQLAASQNNNSDNDINNSQNNDENEYQLPSRRNLSSALIRYQNRVLAQHSHHLARTVARKAAMNVSHADKLSAANQIQKAANASSASVSSASSASSASNGMSRSASSDGSMPASDNGIAVSAQASEQAARTKRMHHVARYYFSTFLNLYNQSEYPDLNHFVLSLADKANRNNLSHKIHIQFTPVSSSADNSRHHKAAISGSSALSSSAASNSKSSSKIASAAQKSASSASKSAKGSVVYRASASADNHKNTASQKEFNHIVDKAADGLSRVASHFNDHKANHKIFKKMFKLAKTKLGEPYVWGGDGAHGFDCSGFTQYIYYHALHHLLPRTAGAQYAASKPIPESQAKPGDLVFFGGSPYSIEHVGMYIGHGEMIDAQLRGVIIEHIHEPWWDLVGFGHVKL